METIPKNSTELVEVIDNEICVSHRTIAQFTNNQEKNLAEMIAKYKSHIEEFGVIPFKTDKPTKGSNGGRPIITHYLNEQQATFLMTLLRNNPTVVNFKKNLVKAFFIMKQQNNNLISALKKEIEQVELNPDFEEFRDDENYLLKRYLYALEENGTFVQRFVIQLIEENHKQKMELEKKMLVSQNLIGTNIQNYNTPVSKLFERFYQYIQNNKSSFKIIPKYEKMKIHRDFRTVFPFGIINQKENTLIITVKELNVFCDRNNFSNREFLNAFSERGLLIKDNEPMIVDYIYVNCYMFKGVYI